MKHNFVLVDLHDLSQIILNITKILCDQRYFLLTFPKHRKNGASTPQRPFLMI